MGLLRAYLSNFSLRYRGGAAAPSVLRVESRAQTLIELYRRVDLRLSDGDALDIDTDPSPQAITGS